MSRRILMLALPGLTLAVAGLFHPHHLSYDTSWRWFALHVPGVLVFPLVGWALAELMHERRDPVAPTGVAGMFLLGVGTAATAWSARRATLGVPTAS